MRKGLFGMDFEREGKGVPEDGRKDPAGIRFFKIIQRKFWAMLRLNLMQVVGNLPAMALAVVFIAPLYKDVVFGSEEEWLFQLLTACILSNLQLVVVGPVHAGFIYVLRNYAREEHAFVWFDFVKGIKENWKRATIVSLLDFAVVFMLSYTLRFYRTAGVDLGRMGDFCMAILAVLLLLVAMMHLYLYPMMVTLDLTVKQLYGNALRFAAAKFLPNLAVIVGIAAFDIIMFSCLLTGAIGMLWIGYALPDFLATFYGYLGIEKYIIRKIEGETD